MRGPHYPSTAELVAFRRSLAGVNAEPVNAGYVYRDGAYVLRLRATASEREHGIGYWPRYRGVHGASDAYSLIRGAATAWRQAASR